MKCFDSVVVRLESNQLGKAAEVVSTGLDCEQSRKSEESDLLIEQRSSITVSENILRHAEALSASFFPCPVELTRPTIKPEK